MGCHHRTSASIATTWRVRASICGWYHAMSSPLAIAERSASPRSRRRWDMPSCARSKSSTPARDCFASYIATSARRSISMAEASPSSRIAMPTEASSERSMPSTRNGRRSAARISCASSNSVELVLARHDDRELVATEPRHRGLGATDGPDPDPQGATRTSSPTAWPSESLMSLKESRSSSSTDTGPRCWIAWSTACSGRATVGQGGELVRERQRAWPPWPRAPRAERAGGASRWRGA